MVRGLDGFFDLRVIPNVALCGFEGPPEGGSLAFFRWLWRGGNTSSHSEQRS
jgi:hypothetical protein